MEPESRTKLLKLLGYSKEELQKKITSCLGNGIPEKQHVPEADGFALAAQGSRCSTAEVATASSSSVFFDSLVPPVMSPLEIPVTTDTDGLISQALLVGNFDGAVELCVRADRFADAIILAIAGGEKLLRETQRRYFAKQKTKISQLLSFIVQQKWRDVICTCDLQSWKEALAILLTYSKQEEYAQHCDMLGARLESEGEGVLSNEACLCYISSGNVERLAKCWVKTHETSSPLALQDLVEKVMVLSKSIETLRGSAGPALGPVLAERVTQYASLLASQGCLAAAMSYLPHSSSELPIQQLRDRVFHAQGERMGDQQPPLFPYARVHVGPVSHLSPAAKSSSAPEGPAHQPSPGHPEKPPFTRPVSGQPSVPSLFTPQPVSMAPAQASAGPHSGLFARAGGRPPYSQYVSGVAPATGSEPALSQPLPFSLAGARVPRPATFPSQPPVSGQPVHSASPGVPPPGSTFFAQASVASQLPVQHPAACLVPKAGPPPTLFPSFPFSCPMGVGYPQGGPGAPSTKPLAAPSIPPPPTGQEAWNDPSALRGGLPRKKLSEKFIPPAPITAPVMNLPAMQPALLPQIPRAQESGQAPPGAPKEGSMQLSTERIERKELPPEHQGLKITFEGLVQRCAAVATDPKTKRKLEDAAQRLECLYEKLREQALSPAILAGLHEIARCMEARSYQQGLLLHTQVVGSSSFSEVSSFMPILKVLMTIASKLNV